MFIAVLNSYTQKWGKKPVIIASSWVHYTTSLISLSLQILCAFCGFVVLVQWIVQMRIKMYFCTVWPWRHLWCCAQLHIQKVMEMVALCPHDSTDNGLADGHQKQCHLQAINPHQRYRKGKNTCIQYTHNDRQVINGNSREKAPLL